MEDQTQAAQTPADQPRPRRGWLARNWRWLVPGTLLVLIVLGLLLAGITYARVFGKLKSSQPYKMALERVQNHPKVIQRLGQPVKDDDWFPSGEVFIEGDRGEARLFFHVAGPRGRAQVSTWGKRMEGKWALVQLAITLEDKTRVDLGGVGDETLEEAPPWKPPEDAADQ